MFTFCYVFDQLSSEFKTLGLRDLCFSKSVAMRQGYRIVGISRKLFKKIYDEDIFDMSNLRIFKEIEKNGGCLYSVMSSVS